MTDVPTRPMTATHGGRTGAAPSRDRRPVQSPPGAELTRSLKKLLAGLVEVGLDAAGRGVDRLSSRLEEVAGSGGVAVGSALGGLRAIVAGRNPVWGAVKGTIASLSTRTKVVIVLALVLGLLLGPVVLVLLVLALLVFVVVTAVRSSTPTHS
jgi:hypothetical protein